MKFLQTAVVFLGLLATALSMSATYGIRYSFNELASTQTVVAAATNGVEQVRTITFPNSADDVNFKYISYIDVIDNVSNDKGAYPELIAGGPGYTYATVKLTGTRLGGINTTLQFWVQYQ